LIGPRLIIAVIALALAVGIVVTLAMAALAYQLIRELP